jgi:hypothetical protein
MSTEITKGYRIPAPLVTLNNEYPVADMEDIAGGYHSVKTLDEMYRIPRLHRRVGMICYIINTDEEYRLVANSGTNRTTAANWLKLERGGSGDGSGGGGSIDLSNYVTKAMFVPIQNIVENLPDPSMIATKTDLQTSKNAILNAVDVKISNMATINDIPDVSQFLTKPQVENVIVEFNNLDDVTQPEIDALFRE